MTLTLFEKIDWEKQKGSMIKECWKEETGKRRKKSFISMARLQ
jgi:hypothetical protein